MADKEIVRTERAPAPFQGAPYNQAVKAAGLRDLRLRFPGRQLEREVEPARLREQRQEVVEDGDAGRDVGRAASWREASGGAGAHAAEVNDSS